MPSFKIFFCAIIINLLVVPVLVFAHSEGSCCNKMGGVSYCDSAAGVLVCKNGFYSTCYCSPQAIMDLQLLRGCCLWRGGVVSSYDTLGLVVCNDGSISEECSLQNPSDKIAAW